jgi:hypothetical protein
VRNDELAHELVDRRFKHFDKARVRTALLINGSGQVLAQHGFTRSYEVMNVASLAAAAHAAARALAQLTEAGSWTHLHHAGKQRQLFMAPIKAPLLGADRRVAGIAAAHLPDDAEQFRAGPAGGFE